MNTTNNPEYRYETSSKRFKRCPNCGQRQIEWKENLTRGLVVTLGKLYNAVLEKGENDIHNTEEASFTHSELCNWSKLRYHGLIFPIKDEDGKRISGRWGISKRGYRFLMGYIELPKFVWSYNKHISDADDAKSDRLVTVSDIMKEPVYFQKWDEFEGREHEPEQGGLF